jgi:hypothetical protein
VLKVPNRDPYSTCEHQLRMGWVFAELRRGRKDLDPKFECFVVPALFPMLFALLAVMQSQRRGFMPPQAARELLRPSAIRSSMFAPPRRQLLARQVIYFGRKQY